MLNRYTVEKPYRGFESLRHRHPLLMQGGSFNQHRTAGDGGSVGLPRASLKLGAFVALASPPDLLARYARRASPLRHRQTFTTNVRSGMGGRVPSLNVRFAPCVDGSPLARVF